MDGLRGIAILLVISWHYVVPQLFLWKGPLAGATATVLSLAWSGVDLFFVLSGFLLGGILLDARESEHYYAPFYARRAFRILPLYFFILGYAAVLKLSGLNGYLYEGRIPWYVYATFTQNIWIAAHTDWGARVLGGTWSLAVEEQFYLILPFVIRRARNLPVVLVTMICLAPIARLLCCWLFPTYTLAPLVLMPCRMDSLMTGVLGAWLVRKGVALPPKLTLVLLAGVGVMMVKHWVLGTLVLNSIGFTWLAWLYLALLLSARGASGPVLTNGLLVNLGVTSYAIYILHGIVLLSIRGDPASGSDRPVLLTLASLLATVVLANLSWRWLEARFIRLGHRWAYSPSR